MTNAPSKLAFTVLLAWALAGCRSIHRDADRRSTAALHDPHAAEFDHTPEEVVDPGATERSQPLTPTLSPLKGERETLKPDAGGIPETDQELPTVIPISGEQPAPPLPEGPAPPVKQEPTELTLERLQQVALENNPSLRQAEWIAERARGRWLQVGLPPNPVAGYNADEIGNDRTGGIQGAFIGQRFVRGNKLEWNRTVASHDVQRAVQQAEMQRQRVLTDVRIQFFEALGAQQAVTLTRQLQKFAREGTKLARDLKSAGQAPLTDVLQAQVDEQSIDLLLKNAEQRETAARRQLAALVGLSTLPGGQLRGALPANGTRVSRDAMWQRIAGQNPLLKIAATNIERARAQQQRERVQPIPDLNTQLSTAYDFSTDLTVVGLQFGVMLPVRNRNQGNIAAAHAQLHQAQENRARLELLLKRRFAGVFRRYDVARSRALAYRETDYWIFPDSILDKAKQTLEIITDTARGGQLSLLNVLTVRRTYFRLKLQALDAEIELQKALAELDGLLLTGGLLSPANIGLSGNTSNNQSGPTGASTLSLTDTPKTQ